MKRNLIYTSKFDGEGYIVVFGNDAWKVTKGYIVVAKFKMVGTLYFLTNIYNYSMDLVSISEDASMWHHKLRHMSEKGIQIYYSKKNLLNFKEIHLVFCEYYVYWKKMMFLSVGKDKKKGKLKLLQIYV